MDKKSRLEIEKELDRLQNELNKEAEKPQNERNGAKTLSIKWAIDDLQYKLLGIERNENY